MSVLLTLGFWSILGWLVLAVSILLGIRLIWALANGSERAIVLMTRTGMHTTARGLLAWLIDYDESTYSRSRYIVWNRVSVRFALLWGSFVLLGLVLLFFQQVRKLDHPLLVWLLAAVSYLAYRAVRISWVPQRPMIRSRDKELTDLLDEVNGRPRGTYESGRHIIRQWDYLDELYADLV